jgi:hypothetical protein
MASNFISPESSKLLPVPQHKHSSWSRSVGGRLCDLPEEGEESDDGSPRVQTRNPSLEDEMTSPALSGPGYRYSTDSYDLKITTPEGDSSFQSEYRESFDAALGTGFSGLDLEKDLFFKAPPARRESAALNSSWV